MNYRERMAHHVAQNQSWSQVVDDFENEAAARVADQVRGRMDRRMAPLDPLYVAARLLDTNFAYRRAQSLRDTHRRVAVMFGIAALVEQFAERGDAA